MESVGHLFVDNYLPLFGGVPQGIETGMALLVLLIVGLIGLWVYRDAKKRGSGWAWQWAIGVVILLLMGIVPGLIAVVIYVLLRDD